MLHTIGEQIVNGHDVSVLALSPTTSSASKSSRVSVKDYRRYTCVHLQTQWLSFSEIDRI